MNNMNLNNHNNHNIHNIEMSINEGEGSNSRGGSLGGRKISGVSQLRESYAEAKVCRRMIIERVELENFKSYAGTKVIGPLHKVLLYIYIYIYIYIVSDSSSRPQWQWEV